MDTHNFAHRAEYHGISVWANRNSAPKWTVKELGAALSKDILGDSGAVMRGAAQAMAICNEGDSRRLVATKAILAAAEEPPQA